VPAEPNYRDYPLEEVAEAVADHARNSWFAYQKFTCAGCGRRLTVDVPNVLYRSGTCDACSAVTDIAAAGCNYVLTSVAASPTSPAFVPPAED
jgi:hypothetical protein